MHHKKIKNESKILQEKNLKKKSTKFENVVIIYYLQTFSDNISVYAYSSSHYFVLLPILHQRTWYFFNKTGGK